MMKENKEDNLSEDIFKEAREESIRKAIEEKEKNNEVAITGFQDKEKVINVIKERIEEGETQWDLLKKAIDGSLTERFINILSSMNDRDFSRNYLKLVEHFKPKVTRVDYSDEDKKDSTININVAILNEKGEKEIINIEDINQKT